MGDSGARILRVYLWHANHTACASGKNELHPNTDDRLKTPKNLENFNQNSTIF
jgi:hypothetical protein